METWWHLPGFLNWGDVSLAAALAGIDIKFLNAVTMSGRSLDTVLVKQYEDEFNKVRKVCGSKGLTTFN